MRRGHSRAGFTLVEVMIALLILGMGLGILLRSASGNVASAKRAQMKAVAAELARAKMYDLEEELLQEGFQQLDRELDGDFEEEGWEKIEWEATIVKIELPNLQALTAIGGADSEGGGAAGMLGGIMGLIPSAGLTEGADASAAAGAALLGSQYEMISNILEESIRKVTLTLKWKVGREKQKLVVDCYFTEPAAISRALGGFAGGSGDGDGDGDGSGSGSGSGAGSGTTRGGSLR